MKNRAHCCCTEGLAVGILKGYGHLRSRADAPRAAQVCRCDEFRVTRIDQRGRRGHIDHLGQHAGRLVESGSEILKAMIRRRGLGKLREAVRRLCRSTDGQIVRQHGRFSRYHGPTRYAGHRRYHAGSRGSGFGVPIHNQIGIQDTLRRRWHCINEQGQRAEQQLGSHRGHDDCCTVDTPASSQFLREISLHQFHDGLILPFLVCAKSGL